MKLKTIFAALLVALASPAIAANVPQAVYFVSSVSNLRTIPGAAAPQYSSLLVSTGNYTDCMFQWNAASSATDNGTSVIKPTDVSGNGRWICTGLQFPGNGGGLVNTSGYLSVGGPPSQYNVPAEPPIGLGAVSSTANPLFFSVTGYGGSVPIHSHVAGGTAAAPTAPVSGANIMSIAARAFDPMTNTFAGSSLAIQGILDENSTDIYTGAHMVIETTPIGGISPRRVNTTFNADGTMTNAYGIGIGVAAPTNLLEARNDINGSTKLVVTNASGGGAANAQLDLANATSDGQLIKVGTGFTPSGVFIPNTTLLTDGGAGLTLAVTTSNPIKFFTNSVQRANLSQAGAWQWNAYGAGTLTTDASGNVTATSDPRLKVDLGHYGRGLIDVLRIDPRLYRWRKESGMETKAVYAGFMATDNFPVREAVSRGPNGYNTFNDRPVIAALVNAVKALVWLLGLSWLGFGAALYLTRRRA